jgi:hypothetical protein
LWLRWILPLPSATAIEPAPAIDLAVASFPQRNQKPRHPERRCSRHFVSNAVEGSPYLHFGFVLVSALSFPHHSVAKRRNVLQLPILPLEPKRLTAPSASHAVEKPFSRTQNSCQAPNTTKPAPAAAFSRGVLVSSRKVKWKGTDEKVLDWTQSSAYDG